MLVLVTFFHFVWPYPEWFHLCLVILFLVYLSLSAFLCTHQFIMLIMCLSLFLSFTVCHYYIELPTWF